MRPTDATNKTRLVLAVPQELLREALCGLLEAAGVDVVASCACAAELERCLRTHVPDVALIDADLAAAGEFGELVRGARKALPHGALVVLAPAVDRALARQTVAVGVDGVVLKSAASEDVVGALQRLAAGDAVFPSGWLSAAMAPVKLQLSERQREVLELLALGLPNDVIAERLFISKNTVKFHVAAIYQRLGVSNRVQAAGALRDLLAA